MDRFIKPSIFIGALSGLILGILLLIPFIAPFVFFLAFSLSGIVVIVIMKRTSYVGLLSLQDGCLIGALAGFVSLLVTSVIYLPTAWLIDKIFNLYSSNTFSLSKSLAITGYDILAVSMIVVFTALLSALFNAFSGMITAFIYQKIDSEPLNFQDHLDIEQIDDSY